MVLYRKQARVTRRVPVPAAKGTHTVIVDQLPGTTTLQTLDVVRSQGLEVQGMKLLTDSTTLVKSPELKPLMPSYKFLQLREHDLKARCNC